MILNKIKLIVVITARPSYSRIKSVLNALKKIDEIELIIVLTASANIEKYGNVIDMIESDGFKVSYTLDNVVESNTSVGMAKGTGLSTIDLSNLFDIIKPKAVICIADRFETLATSISAAFNNILLIHVQGGEVTGNIDDKVRNANTQLADYHFVSNKMAFDRVIKMGASEQNTFNFGCPSIDLIFDTNLEFDFDPFSKYGGVGGFFNIKKDYIVVLQHPETTSLITPIEQIKATITTISKLDCEVFWFWPNNDAGSDQIAKALRIYRESNKESNIHFYKNLEPTDFLKLIYNSKCLVGNSSVGVREASSLGIPVVNIGGRQDGRERSDNVIDVDYDSNSIYEAIRYQVNHGRYEQSYIYGKGDSGKEIANKIYEIIKS